MFSRSVRTEVKEGESIMSDVSSMRRRREVVVLREAREEEGCMPDEERT